MMKQRIKIEKIMANVWVLLLLLTAGCSKEDVLNQTEDEYIRISGLNIGLVATESRAADDSQSQVKEAPFDNGDKLTITITVGNNASDTYTATYTGSAWSLSKGATPINHILLRKNDVTSIKIEYDGIDKLKAEAKKETTWTNVFGSISLPTNGGELTATLGHTQALLVTNIHTEVGVVTNITPKITAGETSSAYPKNTDAAKPSFETFVLPAESGTTLTGFKVMIGTQEITLNKKKHADETTSDISIELKANTRYTFNITLLPGEYTVTPGNSTAWGAGQAIKKDGDWIEISTAEQLAKVGSNEVINGKTYSAESKYIQTADIDLSTYNNGTWTPLPEFKGIYNGNGYRIKNLSTVQTATRIIPNDPPTSPDAYYTSGLFSYVGQTKTDGKMAIIHDVHIEGVKMDVTASNYLYVGALTGFAEHAIISRCSVKGIQQDDNNQVYAHRNPAGTCFVGGLIGDVYENVYITQCWTADLSIKAYNSRMTRVGGLIGFFNSHSFRSAVVACFVLRPTLTISNLYQSSGTYPWDVGGLIGQMQGENAKSEVFGCYTKNVTFQLNNLNNARSGTLLGLLGTVGGTNSEVSVTSCYTTRDAGTYNFIGYLYNTTGSDIINCASNGYTVNGMTASGTPFNYATQLSIGTINVPTVTASIASNNKYSLETSEKPWTAAGIWNFENELPTINLLYTPKE